MLNTEALIKEFKLKAIKSSGSGGQHVNKVATKIELSFSVTQSLILSEEQKLTIKAKLGNRLTKEAILILQCGESRSQLKNKQIIIKRAISILEKALKVDTIRKPTKIPKSVIKKRLKNKKHNAIRKANRKKPNLD